MPRNKYLVWLAGLLFVGMVLVKFSPEYGFTGLIRFGQTWRDHHVSSLQQESIATVADSNGYDGQFYAQVALDPTLRDPGLREALDAPAYRARRILVPATAYFLGLGQPRWILQAYALLNVVCWFATGWLLLRFLPGDSLRDLARWLGCMFSMGVLDSVRQSLVDLPALFLLALACSSTGSPSAVRTNLLLALGNLAKETNLLGAFALNLDPVRWTRWKRSVLLMGAGALPLIAWIGYVHYRFQTSSGPVGVGNFDWPLAGMANQVISSLSHLKAGELDGRYSMGLAAAVGLLSQAWLFWRHPAPASPWWRIGAAYSVLLVFLGPWVWSGYWAVERAVLPMTVAFNLLLPANRLFWPWWAVANLTALHAVWRFL